MKGHLSEEYFNSLYSYTGFYLGYFKEKCQVLTKPEFMELFQPSCIFFYMYVYNTTSGKEHTVVGQ